jgi:GNAT superfamily N-acetyltransferase
MTLKYPLLSRLLHAPEDGFVPGRFNLFAGDYQADKNFLMFYSKDDIRLLVVPEDRLKMYLEAFASDYAGSDAEVIEQARTLEDGQLEAIGPIFLSLLDPDTFSLESQNAAGGYPLVKLDESHITALKALEEACEEIEWDHASLDYDDLSTAYGVLDGETVAALAHYLVYEGDIASIGVITNPDYRGKGLVTAVSVLAIRHALEAGCHVIYRTMGWNSSAIRVALKLGFSEAGDYYILRLKN